jgi:hypothetical protein
VIESAASALRARVFGAIWQMSEVTRHA